MGIRWELIFHARLVDALRHIETVYVLYILLADQPHGSRILLTALPPYTVRTSHRNTQVGSITLSSHHLSLQGARGRGGEKKKGKARKLEERKAKKKGVRRGWVEKQ